MAHNIATIAGTVTMAYLGETPWHRLGTRMTGNPTPEEARKAAGLDWTVSLRPMAFDVPIIGAGNVGQAVSSNGGRTWREVSDRQAVIRDVDGAYLGNVGPGYQVAQNAESMAVLDDMCVRLGARIVTAGALGNGAVCWALAELPGATVDVNGAGDQVKGYFFVRWSHDGSMAITGDLTTIRVVCQNTWRMAASEIGGTGGKVFRVTHTTNVAERLTQAEAIVSKLTEAAIAQGETLGALARRRLTKDEIADYIVRVFPDAGTNDPKTGRLILSPTLVQRRKDVAALIWTGKGAELSGATADGQATAWSVFNAVTEYFDHVRPAQAKSDAARLTAQTSAIFGGYNDIKSKALEAARELVAA